ncbi:regulator of nonsense transcripts 2 [Neocloeon triangulifer]|uniref:regulator of nonsense transcripts 2 n=1 Tax=Neocloeon triangulifer TaxID=2078957 RepID=UPI00286F404F|nr:regulator of nonsense transcripts 2 [Neocloeon triangulifer]
MSGGASGAGDDESSSGQTNHESTEPEKLIEAGQGEEAKESVQEEDAEKQRLENEEKIREENRNYLLDYIRETEERYRERDENRKKNLHVTRPEESHFSKLDSNLKKNTAFVRKIKNLTATQEEALLKDMKTLNLTKYISEIAAGLVEAKLKMTDVQAAVNICAYLHQNYAEFTGHLLENWHKALTFKKDEKIQNISKLRVDLRFYAELINAGIFTNKEGLPLLGTILTNLTGMDKEEHNNINVILSFCRHCGEDYAGLIPRKIRLLSEEFKMLVPTSKLLMPEKQKNVRQLFKDYCTSLCKHLVETHKELRQFEYQNKKILQTKGELSPSRKEKAEALHTAYRKLYEGTQSFCEILDEDMPELEAEDIARSEEQDLKVTGMDAEEFTKESLLWEDEETRYFYEELPDLKAFLPSILYKDSAQATIQPEPEEVTESKLDEELEEIEEGKEEAKKEDTPPVEIEEPEEPETTTNASNKIVMDAFVNHVMNCVSRDMIDNAASEFVLSLNTKINRKKLVRCLFGVQRTRIDLLPFLARLVATLHPCMPDVATDLALKLKQDFKYHFRKKDQINIESKIKVVRFIGEMVKFKMYSKVEALYCLKLLLHDFTHHHIEMACNLLEVCGRFLLRSPDSHQRTKVYLEQMMRKKSVMALDSRYVTMIENAYYHVDPPEVGPGQMREELPPLHEYIRKLVYQDLSKQTTDRILRQMRKLKWNEAESAAFAVKCMTHVWNVKYLNIGCLASLLAGLAAYQDAAATQVVDGIFEEIRLGMEQNHPKFNQRRIAVIKFLGELYNYRLVESGDIFKVLYSLITFGVSEDRENPSPLDSPENLFRIRLACVLLDTCGQYFNSGTSKKRLDYFFVYFQNYFWMKRSHPMWTEDSPFPLGLEYMYRDTVTTLRPRLQLHTEWEAAKEAVKKLQEELMALLPKEEPAEESNAAGGLAPIAETTQEEEEEEEEWSEEQRRTPDLRPKARGQRLSLHTIPENEEDLEGQIEDTSDNDNSEQHEIGQEQTESYSQSQDENMVLTGDDVEFPVEMDGDGDDSVVSKHPRKIECAEDDDFMTAFDKMVSENIQDRMKETVKPPRVDISVPMNLKSSSSKKGYDQLMMEPKEADEERTINFVLMVRKGNKPQFKNLEVPVDSELALNLKNREEAERAEKEKVKKLTLDINERLEEEDYQEMLAQLQRPATVVPGRERRPKYQHPKGAPDADLIFGPKK